MGHTVGIGGVGALDIFAAFQFKLDTGNVLSGDRVDLMQYQIRLNSIADRRGVDDLYTRLFIRHIRHAVNRSSCARGAVVDLVSNGIAIRNIDLGHGVHNGCAVNRLGRQVLKGVSPAIAVA